MGNKVVIFTEEQLEDYQDCTFFNRKEILRVQKRYRELDPIMVPETMTGKESKMVKVPLDKLEKLPELKENPFRTRICKVFSDDGEGNLSFDDFLDMFSTFCEQSPREIKIVYAFKIYDYDGDGFIGHTDLQNTVKALTNNELTLEEVQLVADKVLEEADVDDDGKLSFMEFEHVVTRSPDFMRFAIFINMTR
ncbi:CIB3 (predicted) [Pycnogonum litorale]